MNLPSWLERNRIGWINAKLLDWPWNLNQRLSISVKHWAVAQFRVRLGNERLARKPTNLWRGEGVRETRYYSTYWTTLVPFRQNFTTYSKQIYAPLNPSVRSCQHFGNRFRGCREIAIQIRLMTEYRYNNHDLRSTGSSLFHEDGHAHPYGRWFFKKSIAQGVFEESIKVITTMVIGPLDDRTYCARSAFTHLGIWQKLYDCSLHHFSTSQCIPKSVRLTFWQSPTGWLKFERGLFYPRFYG